MLLAVLCAFTDCPDNNSSRSGSTTGAEFTVWSSDCRLLQKCSAAWNLLVCDNAFLS
jgi:hypothetical protein